MSLNNRMSNDNTIPDCTVEQFNKACAEFLKEIGDRTNTQDGIANMHKGLVLHYLGLRNDTPQRLVDQCAHYLQIAGDGALRRGWMLITPDLSQPDQDVDLLDQLG